MLYRSIVISGICTSKRGPPIMFDRGPAVGASLCGAGRCDRGDGESAASLTLESAVS